LGGRRGNVCWLEKREEESKKTEEGGKREIGKIYPGKSKKGTLKTC